MEKIITANDLVDGNVIYLTADGEWSETPKNAAIAIDAEEEKGLLALAQKSVTANRVIDPQPIPVSRDAGTVAPQKLREQIRATGPTVRGDLGYQAER